MRLHFESDLEHQRSAIDAVLDIFSGQSHTGKSLPFIAENGVVPNRCDLGEKRVLENLRSVQRRNGIPQDASLGSWDFSVEMETGTGKTYVYLRTILELNRRYGWQKFIIIVPSVAIREGVIKTLSITRDHFKQIYYNVLYNAYPYSSGNSGLVRQFARNNGIEIMVLTRDAFNKDTNIMNNASDSTYGVKLIDLLIGTNPVLILDEPQKIEGEKSKDAIEKLRSLCRLRYSATHKEPHHLVYRLTPVQAYQRGLVKRIEVFSIFKEADPNRLYLKLLATKAEKNSITAKLEVKQRTNEGYVLKKISVKQGTDLYDKTSAPEYRGVKVRGINAASQTVSFTNGTTLEVGQDVGGNRREVMRFQIAQAIREHLEKRRMLRPHGIKPLALFFVDKVENYESDDGFIKLAFDQEFERAKADFPEIKGLAPEAVRERYFSVMKRESSMESDQEAFNLIMKRKERLLSFDEKVEFIFSHSALAEGWDNPNVFTICALRETISTMRKRQEIGRGLRLPVDQDGRRDTERTHTLTVVANEHYSEYCASLQSEYAEDGLISPPDPEDRQKRVIVAPKQGFANNSLFVALWEKLRKRTAYTVAINTKSIVEECARELDNFTASTPSYRFQKFLIDVSERDVSAVVEAEETVAENRDYPLANLLERLQEETPLTRATILAILERTRALDQVFIDPEEFISVAGKVIRNVASEHMINDITYEITDSEYDLGIFEAFYAYERRVLGDLQNALTNVIEVDESGVERAVAHEMDQRKDIKLYFKIPRGFSIDTPVGKYTPDWAIVKQEGLLTGAPRKTINLVCETKSVREEDLEGQEKWKVRAGHAHFRAIKEIEFKVITSPEEI